MTKEEKFWQWFRNHELELFDFEKNQDLVFDGLTDALTNVHRDLTFEIGPKENGEREFVITAGGLKEAFPTVERLYGSRPGLLRFRVTKFRPRRNGVGNVEFNGLRIKGEDVYYRLCKEKNPTKVGILLFMPRYLKERESDFSTIGFLMLDAAIGEYAVETSVGFIEIVDHHSRHFFGSYPIHELAEHFDEVMARKKD